MPAAPTPVSPRLAPAGPAAGFRLRPIEEIGLDLVGAVGLVGFVAGLVLLQASDQIGFDPGAAIGGVLGQLAVTGPAALLVGVAVVLELAAGLVLARALRAQPFDSISEIVLAAFAGLVLKEAVELGLLGAVGLFRAPELAAVDVLIVVIALGITPVRRRLLPVLAPGAIRRGVRSLGGPWPLLVLVALAWAGPVVLQLASPVVPFIDVLPNHVAPAEHLRTFGELSPLNATQSPIYGPSRALLGIDAILGTLASLTTLPAGLATAAFVLPSAVLVATGVQRIATTVAGDELRIGPWALLAFAVTESFARLGDARGTVIVLPLVLAALALALEASIDDGRSRSSLGWRWGTGPALGLVLGAAVLVHPVMGAFAVASVVLLALVRPARLGLDAAIALPTAAIVALPQIGVTLGGAVPTPVLAAAPVLAVAVGAWIARRLARVSGARRRAAATTTRLRWVVVSAVVLVLAGGVALGLLDPGRAGTAVGATVQLVLDGCGVLLVALVVVLAAGSRGARSTLVGVTVAVGLAAVLVTQLVADDLGFLGDALRFEVPKTVHYWLPVFVAIAVGVGLAHVADAIERPAGAKAADDLVPPGWQPAGSPPARPTTAGLAGGSMIGGLPVAGWLLALCVVVGLFVLPIRPDAIDPYHLGEHRLSEAVAIDLHYAASGFWIGYPDSRTVVDAPRQAILDAVRREIDAGRLGPDTPVLHVAASFQQWVSTPLGVFDGVDETFVSPDQEVSQQTVGGRLYAPDSLAALVESSDFRYIVLEPNRLTIAASARAAILAAGYIPIFSNGQGTLFASGPVGG